MNNQAFSKIWIPIILIVVFAGGIFVWQYFGTPEEKAEEAGEITEDETADWQTYRNEEYGFEIKYPSKYKTVIDNYGWLNSVIHFIEKEPGTQAYRATISVWNNQDDYEKSTVYSAMRYSLHNVGSKYIAISYFATDNENDLINEWQKIINTLKSIK